MIYVYLLSILIARVVQAVFSKMSSNKAGNIAVTVRYTAYQYTLSAVLGLVLVLGSLSELKIDLPTAAIALLSGASLFFSTFFSIYGMKSGTVSLVSMFSTAGLLVPVAAGVFLFDQPVSLLQGVGTAVFVINQFATKLTALLPPVFLFTFINGGGTVISTLVAAAMYKEKLSVYSILGVIIGIGAMVIIKLC